MFAEVNKVGGASLKDIYAMGTLKRHVDFEMKRPTILVVSAFKNVTNILERLSLFLYVGNIKRAEEEKEKILKLHFKITYDLFPQGHKVFEKIIDIVKSIDTNKYAKADYNFICGEIMGLGEDLSKMIVADYLEFKGTKNELVDSREFIFTDSLANSELHWNGETKHVIKEFFTRKENPLIIMQGFVGRDIVSGRNSVMKREYSDVSAVAVAVALGVPELKFWKKRGVEGNPAQISIGEFKELEKNKEDLLAEAALKMIEDSKISFSIINFDNIKEKTLVHF